MTTTLPEDKEIIFAYLTIHDFFDTYIVQDALQYLQSILKAATGKKVWKRSCPFSLLHYIAQLDKLCTAAFTIHNNYAQRAQAIISNPPIDGNPNINQLQACKGSKRGDTLWSCFPRSLTLSQYYDPYKAIKKNCNYMPEPGWKKALAELQEYALSPATINDIYPPYNILMLQLRLAQLIEACHLLEVRTNNTNKKSAEKNENT